MKTLENLVLLVSLSLSAASAAGQGDRLQLHQADNFEVVLSDYQDTTFVTGSVIFENKNGLYYCDSALWVKGVSLFLKGNVIVDGKEQRIAADSLDYDLVTGDALALGSRVEIWSYQDSLLAVGDHAYYQREDGSFSMENRPTVFLNYPDTTRMIEVTADRIDFFDAEQRTEASGNVTISSMEFSSASGCAIMWPKLNLLELAESPVAYRGKSRIAGAAIAIATDGSQIRRIDIIDSASSELIETTDTASGWVDRSTMSGDRIVMEFVAGELTTVTSFGQSFSTYFPSSRGRDEESQNAVSGDTIRLGIVEDKLTTVEVFGGAVGTYLSSKRSVVDSLPVTTTDTIDYQSNYIRYDIRDSLITLKQSGQVRSGLMMLNAHLIEYDTRAEVIRAFSADINGGEVVADSVSTAELQPNDIPVALVDKGEAIYGDYLEYSLETKKGRILKSKSQYETGFFYGRDVHRQREDIFYLHDGKYTTCDADEPHFHFSSKNLKLMENDRLIASPVVFYIGRIPIFALPYYVFSLKKGRHSGILPFTFGNLQRGERYLRNVGYYIAASEYWDWQGAFDFFEENSRLNVYSRLNYNKRYHFSGSVRGNYGRSTPFDDATSREDKQNRWSLEANHHHELSPSFKFDASGKIQSDATFFNDFSTNLNDRLDRNVTSKLNFTKRFSRSVTLSGSSSHVVNLDLETRTTSFPVFNLSLPTLRPFGEGTKDESGRLRQGWHNNITLRYNPGFRNFSSRITNYTVDTTFILDSLGAVTDTTLDSTGVRSRKKYTRIDHNPSLNLPVMRIARYLRLRPTISYSESWYKIHETDQSRAAGIVASTYRAYSYSATLGLTTDIYGTVYPNMFGLVGLRQVLTPSVSYSFIPRIDKHSEVRGFAGGGPGSATQRQSMNISLSQVYQAKVKQGEAERTLELMTVTSSVGYDFENEVRPFSKLNTTFRSYLLPNINFDGSMTHSLYKPETDDLTLLSPVLESFRVNANISLGGSRFLFDDAVAFIPLGLDSASQLASGIPGANVDSQPVDAGPRGWSFRANYGYSESGRQTSFIKSSFVRFTLNFNLTRNTSVTYGQSYDFVKRKTVNSQVNITRKLHAWTGNFFWVPVGSNKGFGFRLFVTAIPAIKFDNSQNNLSAGLFDDLR